MFDNIKADIRRYLDHNYKKGFLGAIRMYLEYPALWAITDYRFRKWAWKYMFRVPIIGFLLYISYKSIFSNFIYAFTGIDMHHGADIKGGLFIAHGNGLVISGRVRIGKNCGLWQQVTIGVGKNHKEPKIGNNVKIYTGSKVFGPITIGDNVEIGANAVVNKSFPSNVVIAGVPAEILHKIKKKE